ncbi:hypothetical protein Tco_0371434 [Tanacetum coccineum]
MAFKEEVVISFPRDVLSNHVLATPARVRGNTRRRAQSFVLNRLATSSTFPRCSIAFSVKLPEKILIRMPQIHKKYRFCGLEQANCDLDGDIAIEIISVMGGNLWNNNNIIMSDSEHSTVTYTSVPFPVEDDSDIGSPGIDGPPMMPEDPYAYIMAAYEVPPSPDYIPGPEVPPSPDYIPGPEEPQSPPPLDFVPEPMYPEYMPQEDEILPAEEQPLPATAASPTADSPGYVPESDPEEDDEDPEEDPADYPADGDDDDDEDEDEEEEEEEHPAPANSVPPIRSTSRELDYGITDTWDDLVGAIDEIAPTTVEGVNQRVTDLATIVEEETTSMYGIGLFRRLAVMIEREAKMAREAWGLSMDASDYARSDVMSLRTTVVAQSALISELQSADHRRQRVISELLASDHKRQVQLTKTLRLLKKIQTRWSSFRGAWTRKGPFQPDAPGEASSSFLIDLVML